MQDDEKYKKIKEALDRLHIQQNSKENSNSQTLDNNKTINNQNLNLENINLSNSKDNLNNQSYLQNNAKQNFKNSDNDLNFNKNNNSSNSINQRDYDKEPIIMKDYKPTILFFCYFFLIISSIPATVIYNYDLNKILVFYITLYITTLKFNYIDYMFNSKITIIFKNNLIAMNNHENEILKIPVNEIFAINKTPDMRRFLIKNISRNLILISFLLVAIFFIIFSIDKFLIAILALYFMYFFPKNLIQVLHGGFRSIRFFDCLGIYSVDGAFINIFIYSEKQYGEIKEYFLIQKNKNIDKLEKHFFIYQ